MTSEHSRVYVEIDALLDTRLGALCCIDPELVDQALALGYRSRKSDDWKELGLSVDPVRYQQTYAERGVEVLQASRASKVVAMLNGLAASLVEAQPYQPNIGPAKIEINLWPYQMTQEVADEFARGIQFSVGQAAEVVSVSYSPEQLTPELIDDRWDALVMYDFDRWLNVHQAALQKKRLVSTTFIAPALYRNKLPTKADLTVEGYGEVNAFAALETVLSEYLTLVMVDAEMFSLVDL